MVKNNTGKELKSLDDFTKAYLVAAVEYTNDDKGIPLFKNFELKDIDIDHFMEVKKDCMEFQNHHKDLLSEAYKKPGYTPEQAGHDFWLTRNNHGVGYWDRELGPVGNVLSEKSTDLKGSDIYEGDDGKLYFTNLPFHRKQLSLKF